MRLIVFGIPASDMTVLLLYWEPQNTEGAMSKDFIPFTLTQGHVMHLLEPSHIIVYYWNAHDRFSRYECFFFVQAL